MEIRHMSKLFGKIKDAKVTTQSEFLKEGTYWVHISKVKEDETRNFDPFFAVEGKVVNVIDGGNEEKDNHFVGEEVSEFRSAKSDYFGQDVKRTVSAIMGRDPADITEEIYNKIIGDTQPAKGIVVEYYIKNKALKNDATKFFSNVTCRRMVPKEELTREVLEAVGEGNLSPIYG